MKSCKSEIRKEDAVGWGVKNNAVLMLPVSFCSTWCKKAGEVGVKKEMETKTLSQRQELNLCSWEGRYSRTMQMADGGCYKVPEGQAQKESGWKGPLEPCSPTYCSNQA